MEDNYVVCIRNDVHPSQNILKVGEKYHVEEAFNFDPNDTVWNDPESVTRMITKYPNPYFYLEEVKETCPCCGERLYFWHGLFETKEKYLSHGTMEALEEESRL